MKPRTVGGSKPTIAAVAGERPAVAAPSASIVVDPMGRASAAGRDHLVTVTLELGEAAPRFADKTAAAAVARQSLAAYVATDGPDGRKLRELTQTRRGKAGVVTNVVVAVEVSVVWAERPDDASVGLMRAALIAEGYRVSLRERHECTESGCSTDVVIAWGLLDVPTGWFSQRICGRHNFRRCGKCKSIYHLTSMNAAGQGPSVHCQVCEQVLVEWGSSKIWDAELIARGDGEPITGGNAEIVTHGAAALVTGGDAEPVTRGDSEPILRGDSEPILRSVPELVTRGDREPS